MKVFVTGGNGFFGSHLCAAMQRDGISYDAPFRRELDCVDEYALRVRFDRVAPDVVVHVAGRAHGDEAQIVHDNIDVTRAVVAIAREYNVPVIAAGSVAEYGNAPTPFLESTIPEPQSMYARSKLAASRLVLESSGACGGIVLRFTNIFGAGDSHSFIAHVVAAVRGGPPVRVTDAIERDFLHVDDAVSAMLTAARKAPRSVGSVFNIASGRVYTTAQLARLVADMCDLAPSAIIAADSFEPPLDMQRSNRCDNAAACTQLPWSPAVLLEDGIRALLA